MTGLYERSLIERRRIARADVNRCKKNLESLREPASNYAEEHRALLEMLEQVCAIYDNAPDGLVSNKK